jgi:DNA gyrase/topoisomerase IV subunit B
VGASLVTKLHLPAFFFSGSMQDIMKRHNIQVVYQEIFRQHVRIGAQHFFYLLKEREREREIKSEKEREREMKRERGLIQVVK